MTPDCHNALHPVVLDVGLTLQGFSISGVATWIVIPELDVMFDAGECPMFAVPVNNVLLSHAHGDHSRCLLRHWQLRRMMKMSEAAYVVPAGTIQGFRDLVDVEARMEGLPPDQVTYPKLYPAPVDGRLVLGRGLWATAFPVEHRVESVGYTIGRTVQKLKPAYQELSGPEIGQLRKEGVAVTDPVDTALVTFIGDCTGASLAANPHIWDSRVVIIEATYVEDEDLPKAVERMHTHLQEVADVLRTVKGPRCDALVLKHFTLKASPERVREQVAKLIPVDWVNRTHVLLPPSTP